jgi:hypothetical protein
MDINMDINHIYRKFQYKQPPRLIPERWVYLSYRPPVNRKTGKMKTWYEYTPKQKAFQYWINEYFFQRVMNDPTHPVNHY